MKARTSLWHLAGGTPSRLDASVPYWLVHDEGGCEPVVERDAGAVVVAPVEPVRQTVAVVLVPDGLGDLVSRNGVPLPPGLSGLRHADRLEVAGRPFWISVEAGPEEAVYDPTVHGPDEYCPITKARLNKGDPVTICGGTPATACTAVYKRTAWQAALASPRPFKCPSCGFDPKQATWEPPLDRQDNTLDQLFQVISERRSAS